MISLHIDQWKVDKIGVKETKVKPDGAYIKYIRTMKQVGLVICPNGKYSIQSQSLSHCDGLTN